MRRAWLLLLVASGCVGSQDQPSNVHDLRVLGISLEPPEIFTNQPCQELLAMFEGIRPLDPAVLVPFFDTVTFRALIADPRGQGRMIAFGLRACASLDDPTCSNESVLLDQGTVPAGNGIDTELVRDIKPGAQTLDGGADAGIPGLGDPLLVHVIEEDPQRGLAGFLMPLSLHLKAQPVPDGGSDQPEEIYAQKFMAFWCPFFPDMQPNQNPQLRGFTLDGEDWPEDAIPTRHGAGPFHVVADDVSDREETYHVPDYGLQDVQLKESWLISYYASLGQFSPDTTGGQNLNGSIDPHSTGWVAGAGADEQYVTFWFVVRDGRGGISWTKRILHYIP